jgi:hypothetical protein
MACPVRLIHRGHWIGVCEFDHDQDVVCDGPDWVVGGDHVPEPRDAPQDAVFRLEVRFSTVHELVGVFEGGGGDLHKLLGFARGVRLGAHSTYIHQFG